MMNNLHVHTKKKNASPTVIDIFPTLSESNCHEPLLEEVQVAASGKSVRMELSSTWKLGTRLIRESESALRLISESFSKKQSFKLMLTIRFVVDSR